MNGENRIEGEVRNLVNEILDFEVPVIVLGLRSDNMLEFISKYNSYAEYKAKFKYDNSIKYKRVVVVFGELNEIVKTIEML